MSNTRYNRILVTAALPYANGPLHIGHLAGCYLPADIFVRFKRAKKENVKFIGGSDEHGVPITIRALNEGITPQEVVDKYHYIIKDSLEKIGISFDIYSRTSSETHRQTSQQFFLNLYEKGIFEEKESEQYYDEQRNMFLADRYIIGTCPECSYEKAYGDQCEKCGTSLSPDQLIAPRSALSSAIPIKKKTKHWYFPLDKYESFLKKWILQDKAGKWKPNVYGQCKSWLDSGLHPRAMTRDSHWGVPVPVKGADGKVLYVWFDAPIGYISATKELIPQSWDEYWKQEDTRLIHFIGKDNIVFHCIIFPAMLKAHGDYVLPENVPANEFLNIEGDKVSTSRNWAVWVDEYLKDFPEMQDVLRYVLCANAPETKDNDFTWKDFQDRNNNELVAIFGNFVNRALVMMHKLCRGKVPPLHKELMDETDKKIIADISEAKLKIETDFENYKFRDGIYEIIDLARKGNKYMQEKAPWIIAKSLPETDLFLNLAPSREQMLIDNCLHICLQLTANLAILAQPILPFTSKKICYLLKVVDRMLEWENAGKIDLLKIGYSLRPPELLFRKVEDEEIALQKNKLRERAETFVKQQQTKEAKQHPFDPPNQVERKEIIDFEDFAKVELRTGVILAAEKVKKADKLLRLEVDLGFDKRTILSGIAMHYQAEEVIGKQVTVVVNLAPRKIRGTESEGMILMAEDNEGNLKFVSPIENMPLGSIIR